MKTIKTILLAAIAMMAWSVSAQNGDTTNTDGNDSPLPLYKYTAAIESDNILKIGSGINTASKICNYNEDYSIAAVRKTATQTYFCLIDHSSLNNTLYSPPSSAPSCSTRYITTKFAGFSSLIVNDMYICSDYLFFCGECIDNSNVKKAVIGYFNILDLLPSSSSINIYYCTLISSTTAPPVSLRKLVAYINSAGIYTVVAIGEDSDGYNYGISKVVEISNATSNLLPFSCNVADFPRLSTSGQVRKVFLDDIVLTNNNVVILGREVNVISTMSNHLWFSIGSKASVVADICSTSAYNNHYLAVPYESVDVVTGVALDSNKFGMAYVGHDNSGFYTRFRVINPATMTNTYSQQYLNNEKYNIVEMTYLEDMRRVELLQPLTDSSNFIQLNPYATSPYTSTILTPDGKEYFSLNRVLLLSTLTSFISVTNGKIYLQHGDSSVPHSNSSCPSNSNLSVSIISSLSINNAPKPTAQTNYYNTLMTTNRPILSNSLNNNCFSYSIK